MAARYGGEYEGYDYNFVDSMDERLTCLICTRVIRDPHITSCCGKHFCESCLERWLAQDKRCPHCRVNCKHFLDRSLQREIKSTLKIYCNHKQEGCQWVGEVRALEDHLASPNGCDYYEVECPNKCQIYVDVIKTMKRKEVENHLKYQCYLRPYQCKYCGHKDTYVAITGVGFRRSRYCHNDKCLEFPLKCPNRCGVKDIKRKDVDYHRSQCPEERIQCPFEEAGCNKYIVRRELEQHLATTQQQHLLMVMGAYKEMKQGYTEMKQTYTHMEQANWEVNRELDKMKVQAKLTKEDHQDQIARLTAKLDKLPAQLSAAEIRGAEVCAETSVIVTNTRQHFRWMSCGLSLHIPERCLPLGVDQCTITIKASLAGQYRFPDGSHLVSVVYWLRCEPSCIFYKAISVEIEHCAPKRNAAKLSVVKTYCTQMQLPYTFKKLEGLGVFTEHSSYGYIKLESFSGIAVVQDGSEEREYCASLYYLERTRLNPEIHFVVVWNTETHLMHISKQYRSKGAVPGPDTGVKFESEAITLDIPTEGVTVNGGWRIIPLTRLRVEKQQVDSFKPRRRIPSCAMQVHPPRAVDASKLPVLSHQVRLQGAKEPFNLLTINYVPTTPDKEPAKHDKPTLKILLTELYCLAHQWENIGVFLGIDDGQLKTLGSNWSQCEDRLREMLRLWLKTDSPTWTAIIRAVELLGDKQLAHRLLQEYCYK